MIFRRFKENDEKFINDFQKISFYLNLIQADY